MEKEEILRGMKELWKDTFHDSEEYVDLVFDSYFNPDYIEYHEVNGRVVSALLGIPYKFGNDKYTVNGVYLCGLATDPKFRKKGIMGELLDRINERMDKKGYAFTFLIPANEGLKRYYIDCQYIPFSYRNEVHYVSGHDFKTDYLSSFVNEGPVRIEEEKENWDALETPKIGGNELKEPSEIKDKIVCFLEEISLTQKCMGILQTRMQLENVLAENAISGGETWICRDKNGKIAAVALMGSGKEVIKVKKLFTLNRIAGYRILGGMSDAYQERSLTIVTYLGDESGSRSEEEDHAKLWQPFYSAVNPEAPTAGAVGEIERVYNPSDSARMYGMMRILDISEILKFQACINENLKYSILVNLGDKEKNTDISIENGEIIFREISKNPSSAAVPGIKEFGRILFRKTGGEDTITKILGIPVIKAPIYLMLD